jgi:hypothetical protein
MVMSLAGLGTKNHCAGERQQQFSRPDRLRLSLNLGHHRFLPHSLQEPFPIPEPLWLCPRDWNIPARWVIPEKTGRSPEVPTVKNILKIINN